MILAIDPGATTGFALSCGLTGSYKPIRLDDGEALAAWWEWLSDLITEHRPECMVIERAFFGRQRDADWTPALIRSAHAIAYLRGIKRGEMAAVTVRKAIFGKATGHSDRDRVAKAREMGWQIEDDHTADAVLLLEAWKQLLKEGNANG